jgi:hypothetical protein
MSKISIPCTPISIPFLFNIYYLSSMEFELNWIEFQFNWSYMHVIQFFHLKLVFTKSFHYFHHLVITTSAYKHKTQVSQWSYLCLLYTHINTLYDCGYLNLAKCKRFLILYILESSSSGFFEYVQNKWVNIYRSPLIFYSKGIKTFIFAQ